MSNSEGINYLPSNANDYSFHYTAKSVSEFTEETLKVQSFAQLNQPLEKTDDDETPNCTNDLKKKDPKLKSSGELLKFGYKRCPSYHGLFYAALSGVFFQLSSVIVKYIKNIAPGELVVIRYIGILVFSLPLLIRSQEKVFGPTKSFHLLVTRSLLGATDTFLRFLAFRYLPLGEASVIIFSMPVFVAIFARILLKESCGLLNSFSIIVSLVGLVLITKPPFVGFGTIRIYNKEYIYGVGGAVGSLIFIGFFYILTRKMADIHYSVILFNFGWVAGIENVVLTFVIDQFTIPTCGLDQWLAILLGIFSFCGQMLMILALKIENAGPVSIVRSATDIVLAFFWQIWYFDETSDNYSIFGAVLVISSILLVNLQKWLKH